MSSMMTQSGLNAYADLDASARRPADRLARATTDQMEAALALLSVLDPEGFEIAFTAVPLASDDCDDGVMPVCCRCGGLIGIFPEHGLQWLHFRGYGSTSGAWQICEPGHAPEVIWILPGEDPDDL
jgi:hypothetical protein